MLTKITKVEQAINNESIFFNLLYLSFHFFSKIDLSKKQFKMIF